MHKLATFLLVCAFPMVALAQAEGEDKVAAARKQLLSRLGPALRAYKGKEDRTFKRFIEALAKAKAEHGAALEDEIRKEALARIAKEQTDQIAAITKAFDKDDDVLRPKLDRELNKRRRRALSLIFSKGSYPNKKRSAKRHKKAQVEVDKRVAAVREIWTTPAKGIVSFDSRVKTAYQRLAALRGIRPVFDASAKDTTQTAVAKLEAGVNEKVDLKQPFKDDTTSTLYESLGTMRSNAKKTAGSDAERELVKLTNEYRVMMGFAAMSIDSSLMKCARAHSDYMAKTNKFAHNIRGHPDGVTPSARAKKYGHGGLVAENIARGSKPSPAHALNMWLHSAGHHRNILSPKHTGIGVGQSGDMWTQVFG